jgi:transcriptional/translational regulatory protein YebC/TACO1
LGTNGSLSYVFETKGVFTIPNESISDWDKDELELELIDGGAEEVELDDENLTVFTSFDQYGDMQSKLQELNITPTSTEIQQIPLNTKKLELTDAEEVLKIIDKFEEDDDIQSVFHNLELTEELIAKLEDN